MKFLLFKLYTKVPENFEIKLIKIVLSKLEFNTIIFKDHFLQCTNVRFFIYGNDCINREEIVLKPCETDTSEGVATKLS